MGMIVQHPCFNSSIPSRLAFVICLLDMAKIVGRVHRGMISSDADGTTWLLPGKVPALFASKRKRCGRAIGVGE